jgi:hypothetical protein
MKRLMLTPSFAVAFSMFIFSSPLSRINIPLWFHCFRSWAFGLVRLQVSLTHFLGLFARAAVLLSFCRTP